MRWRKRREGPGNELNLTDQSLWEAQSEQGSSPRESASPVITRMSFSSVSRLKNRRNKLGSHHSSMQLSSPSANMRSLGSISSGASLGGISQTLESFLDSHDFSEESLLSYISDHFIQSDQEFHVLSTILQGYKACTARLESHIDEKRSLISEYQKNQKGRLFDHVTLGGTNQSAVSVARGANQSRNAWAFGGRGGGTTTRIVKPGAEGSTTLPPLSSPSNRLRRGRSPASPLQHIQQSSTMLDLNLPSMDKEKNRHQKNNVGDGIVCSITSDLRQVTKSFSQYEKELETRNEILRRALQESTNHVNSLHIQYLAITSTLEEKSIEPNPFTELIQDTLQKISDEIKYKYTHRATLHNMDNVNHYYQNLDQMAQENVKKMETLSIELMSAEPYDFEMKRLKELQKELKKQQRLHEALKNMNRIAKYRIGTMSSVHVDILNIDKEMDSFSDTVTPRPNWEEYESYLDIASKYSSHDYAVQLVTRCQNLIDLHKRNENQIAVNSKKLDFLDLKEGEFFDGLGMDPSVPMHLRYEGKLRRFSFDKKEVEEILDDFWSMRNENNIFFNLSFEEALVEYVEYMMPTSSRRAHMEFMYSFLDGCEQYRDDPDPDLFLRVLNKEVCELAYQDQFDQVHKLKQVFTKLDNKGKLSKAKLLAALRKFFVSKPPESFTILNRTLEHLPSTLNWSKLFAESRLKSQSAFLETVRLQHIEEIIHYTEQICSALISRARYEYILQKFGKNRSQHYTSHPKQYQNIPLNKLNLTVQQICETCFAVDPLQSESLLHKWIHDSTGLSYPLNRSHSFNLNAFLANLRTKVLLKRNCRERDIRAELNRRSHQIVAYDTLLKIVFDVKELLKADSEKESNDTPVEGEQEKASPSDVSPSGKQKVNEIVSGNGEEN
eukprot:CAMPEP_0117436528 /NCGR_PEP_ID=MMETSP0759-20121206/1053_1 /TAXON_ID=63605 /ORGANISM="Percolomonas cosmopolitus, Strain WS" /LENGTH=894 /DNA_ID=CAMNT_0005228129 /DNA_START=237 /DNA_END=2921 /DNA_ORIENTATION=+